jgi:hypothetical protein
MRSTALIFVVVLLGASGSNAQVMLHDPPWNPEHIDRLPPEIRKAVLAMCPTTPAAGHYFATYLHDRVTLHFEHLHCGEPPNAYCRRGLCLHQVYVSNGGHYRLLGSGYGPANDRDRAMPLQVLWSTSTGSPRLILCFLAAASAASR